MALQYLESQNQVLNMPELMDHILSFLDNRELSIVNQVSRYWLSTVTENKRMRPFIERWQYIEKHNIKTCTNCPRDKPNYSMKCRGFHDWRDCHKQKCGEQECPWYHRNRDCPRDYIYNVIGGTKQCDLKLCKKFHKKRDCAEFWLSGECPGMDCWHRDKDGWHDINDIWIHDIPEEYKIDNLKKEYYSTGEKKMSTWKEWYNKPVNKLCNKRHLCINSDLNISQFNGNCICDGTRHSVFRPGYKNCGIRWQGVDNACTIYYKSGYCAGMMDETCTRTHLDIMSGLFPNILCAKTVPNRCIHFWNTGYCDDAKNKTCGMEHYLGPGAKVSLEHNILDIVRRQYILEEFSEESSNNSSED
jgi:hypothetical protein